MEAFELSTYLLTFLFFVALLAGFIDTLAGGGGLIVIPALMMSGIAPLNALGTNKFQSSMGTGMAAFMMLTNRKVSWKAVRSLMLYSFIGSAIGTALVQLMNTELLSFVIPSVLLVIAIYFIMAPTPKATVARVSNKTYRRAIVPLIGGYDGMFGPGTGSFFALSAVVARGQDLISATAFAKPLNFASNVASLTVFVLAGKIVWTVGLVMMLGQFIGVWLGAHCLFSIKPSWLRVLIVVMCLAMLTRFAWVTWV